MLLLTSTSDLIQVVTGSSGAIDVHASWVDNASGTITPGRTNTASIATAATTTVVESPAASTQRNVKMLVVYNASGSVSNLVTVRHTDGSNVKIIWKGTLLSGESLSIDDFGDEHVRDSNGIEKQSIAQSLPLYNSSIATQTGFAANTLLTGSSILLPGGMSVAGVQYEVVFSMVKTAAGTAASAIQILYGPTATTSDALVATLTYGAGTAAVDTGVFTVRGTLRTPGTAGIAAMSAVGMVNHALAATGLTNTGASGTGIISVTGAGAFNSLNTSSYLSLAFNGGASFSGTCDMVQARVWNYRG